MGLLAARIAHNMGRTPSRIVGTAALVTTFTLAAQFGRGADFSTSSPPSDDTFATILVFGGVGAAVGGGYALWGPTPGSRAFGRGAFAVVTGAAGALAVSAPVVRRLIAD